VLSVGRPEREDFGQRVVGEPRVLSGRELDRPEIRLPGLNIALRHEQARAVGRKGRLAIHARLADLLYDLSLSIEDRDLLQLRPAWRRQGEKTFASGADVGKPLGNGGLLSEQDLGRAEGERRSRTDSRDHDRAIARHVIQFLAVAPPEGRAEEAAV